MADQNSLSLEELVRQHNVVESPIAAFDLETGMVLRCEGKLRLVISASFEKTESGPVVVVESVEGLKRFASATPLNVWHINGEPFILELPAEESGLPVPGVGGSGSVPPAHDAAGIVPVWVGPKRIS